MTNRRENVPKMSVQVFRKCRKWKKGEKLAKNMKNCLKTDLGIYRILSKTREQGVQQLDKIR